MKNLLICFVLYLLILITVLGCVSETSDLSESGSEPVEISFFVNLQTDKTIYTPSEINLSILILDARTRVSLKALATQTTQESHITDWSAEVILKITSPQKDTPLGISINSPFLQEQKYELTYDHIRDSELDLGHFLMVPRTYMEFEWCYTSSENEQLTPVKFGRIADHRNPAKSKEMNAYYYLFLSDEHISKEHMDWYYAPDDRTADFSFDGVHLNALPGYRNKKRLRVLPVDNWEQVYPGIRGDSAVMSAPAVPGEFYTVRTNTGGFLYIKIRDIRSLTFNEIDKIISPKKNVWLYNPDDITYLREFENLNIPTVLDGAIAYYTIYTIDEITGDSDVSLLLKPYYLEQPVELTLEKMASGIEGITKWVGYYHVESLEGQDGIVCAMDIIKNGESKWVLPGGDSAEGWMPIHTGRKPRRYNQTDLIQITSLVRRWSDTPETDDYVIELDLKSRENINSLYYGLRFFDPMGTDGSGWHHNYGIQESEDLTIRLPGFHFIPNESDAPVWQSFHFVLSSPLRKTAFFRLYFDKLQQNDYSAIPTHLPNASITSFEYNVLNTAGDEIRPPETGQILIANPEELTAEANEELKHYFSTLSPVGNISAFDLDFDGIEDVTGSSWDALYGKIIQIDDWDHDYTESELDRIFWYGASDTLKAGSIFLVKTSSGMYSKLLITAIEEMTDEQLAPYR